VINVLKLGKKVLFFVDRMRVGGIQILLVDLFKHFDRNCIQPELLILDDGEHYDLEDKVKEMGIPVYKLNGIWLRKAKDYITYFKAVNCFFQEHHDYQAVHINAGPKNFYILKCAKKYHIPVRIAHSHNTGYQTSSKSQQLLGNILKAPLKHSANVYLACSDYAGKWMFGEKLLNAGKVTILPNGIDLDCFKYNETVRNRIRSELYIENKIVIGNVGRFTPQKNHEFLIDIFKELHSIDSNTVLIIAGIGELMEHIKEKVSDFGLQECVKLLGFRDDVTALTQAMDVFVMPSLYEGFPVTAVEAQAAGLPCVFSDTITREVKILEETKYISLEDDVQKWSNEILDIVNTVDREKCNMLLHEKNYDISDMISKLMNIYQLV